MTGEEAEITEGIDEEINVDAPRRAASRRVRGAASERTRPQHWPARRALTSARASRSG